MNFRFYLEINPQKSNPEKVFDLMIAFFQPKEFKHSDCIFELRGTIPVLPSEIKEKLFKFIEETKGPYDQYYSIQFSLLELDMDVNEALTLRSRVALDQIINPNIGKQTK